MHSYIAIQNTYHVFEMALFINNTLQDKLSEDKRHASRMFIPLLNQLLTKNNSDLSGISFCAVNCGPGPFSTLRSIIASVNGLHCATKIPLIAIDGLDATFLEFYDNAYEYTIVLINAFNNEVYYLIAHHTTILAKGYKNIDALLAEVNKQFPEQKINFFGNGVLLHKNIIIEQCAGRAIIAEPTPEYCSLEIIGQLGYDAFQQNIPQPDYLMPLHLKKHPVELL